MLILNFESLWYISIWSVQRESMRISRQTDSNLDRDQTAGQKIFFLWIWWRYCSFYYGLYTADDLILYIIHSCKPAVCFYLGINAALNLIELANVVRIRAPEPSEGYGGLVLFAFGDEVTWGLWHEAQEEHHKQSWNFTSYSEPPPWQNQACKARKEILDTVDHQQAKVSQKDQSILINQIRVPS